MGFQFLRKEEEAEGRECPCRGPLIALGQGQAELYVATEAWYRECGLLP